MTLYPKPVVRRKWMFMLRNCCFSRSECWTQPELSRASHILDGRAPGVGGCGSGQSIHGSWGSNNAFFTEMFFSWWKGQKIWKRKTVALAPPWRWKVSGAYSDAVCVRLFHLQQQPCE